MIRKFISIKNVGRFRNSAAAGNPQLSRYTLIVGANGYGKSTLCAILRSLKSGESDHIVGRRTLGVEDPPNVELLLPDGPTRFDGEIWSTSYSDIAIFDGVFVAENVYSGEVVEIDHRRNLYRVIIGSEGVSLAEEDATIASRSREMTTRINASAKAINPHVPDGMNLDQFLSIPVVTDIDDRIFEAERTVNAVNQARQISEHPLLSEFPVPTLPDNFTRLLARTIDDIAQDAEELVAEHLAGHGMAASGGNWLARGLEHAGGETCPFCGQDIREVSLISAYRDVFSERYKALRGEVTAMRDEIVEQFGDGALGRLTSIAAQNRASAEYWHRFCDLDMHNLAAPQELADAIEALGRAALDLLDRKAKTPLELIQPDEPFTSAAATYEIVQAEAMALNELTSDANAVIASKKEETLSATVQTAELAFTHVRAMKHRHSDAVAGLCAEHVRLLKEKKEIDDRKSEIRVQLDEHSGNVMRPYQKRINQFLDAFNAGFSVAETSHGYPGGKAASSYRLVINDMAIDLGDSRTPADRPSFKNTLSAGDRTTLALAFFLAHLEHDRSLAGKTVVFDDPFSSQDAFRRRQTVNEITKVAKQCAQVVVLSHDATFLKQVWDKAPPSERVALTLADHRAQGSKITPIDLERACKGRTATDIDDLQTFLTTGAGILQDLIRKMRVVLEAHCWTTYPTCFEPSQDWLGEVVRKIRETGDQHLAWDLYDELDQINEYSSDYHHGADPTDVTPDQIDPQELTGYIRRALKLVNALQA